MRERSEKKKKSSLDVIDLNENAPEKKRENRRPGNVSRSQSREKNSGKSRKRSKRSGNRDFWIITYLFLALFLILIAYLVYFQMVKSESIISSSYNTRLDLYEEHVIRGDILSQDGKVLATTKVDEEGKTHREYPYDDLFAHVVGYSNNGKGGLESQYNFNLLRSHSFFLTQIIHDLMDERNQGDSLVTTLDYEVQKAAYDALGDRRGAVVVLDAGTGAVLSMVSKPDFDPNTLASKWDDIVNDASSTVLLNRATSGLYPPGSTFKIFTALEFLHENSDPDAYSYVCEGKLKVDGNEIQCYHNTVHGSEDLEDSFADSCNTSFATIGLGLNRNQFSELVDSMELTKSLPGTIATKAGRFSLSKKDPTDKVMQTMIGQGDTLVTPIYMAWLAAAINNDGKAMTPYVADHMESDGGAVVKRFGGSEYQSLMSKADAASLQALMKAVVEDGTASALKGQSYQAAGKTGSAEYDSKGNSHGWFVGYGSKEGYSDIAIAVIVEDGDSGSKSAVPAAKKIMDVYFNK